MKILSKTILAAALALGIGASGTAHATVVNGTSLQTVINNLYGCAATLTTPECSPVSAAPNVNTDQYALDEQWAIEASGGASATIIIEIAGNASTNTFGIYDLNNGNMVELYSGTANSTDIVQFTLNALGGGSVTYIQRDADGSNTGGSLSFFDNGTFTQNAFGFYMDTVNGTLYSQAAKNAGGVDQMVAYRGDEDLIAVPGNSPGSQWGSSSFILAWEDLDVNHGSDRDFDDFVVYVESVRGVPEPATLALLGVALLGAGALRRRNA